MAIRTHLKLRMGPSSHPALVGGWGSMSPETSMSECLKQNAVLGVTGSPRAHWAERAL